MSVREAKKSCATECTRCKGTGEEDYDDYTDMGVPKVYYRKCTRCNGTGKCGGAK